MLFDIPYSIKKAMNEEFHDECYFSWNPFKNVFQACARDMKQKTSYVVFYVQANMHGGFRYPTIQDIARLRHAKINSNDQRRKRALELHEKSMAEKRAIQARASLKAKPSDFAIQLGKDVQQDHLWRAIMRDQVGKKLPKWARQ